MKTLIAMLVLCAGIYAQECVDSVLIDYKKINVELIEALKTALTYLDESPTTTLLYVSPAQKLRNEADRIEQKEKDLAWIKELYIRAKLIHTLNP